MGNHANGPNGQRQAYKYGYCFVVNTLWQTLDPENLVRSYCGSMQIQGLPQSTPLRIWILAPERLIHTNLASLITILDSKASASSTTSRKKKLLQTAKPSQYFPLHMYRTDYSSRRQSFPVFSTSQITYLHPQESSLAYPVLTTSNLNDSHRCYACINHFLCLGPSLTSLLS